MTPTLRADLHVHTCHSKRNATMPFLGSRDCYSTPSDVYRVAKSRGMDLVAFTDHDSIDGALELLDASPDAPDVIVGEEVTCWLRGKDVRPVEVHLGVYGMTESLHREVQALRSNVFDVTALLREANVFFSLNHLLHFYRGPLPLDVYLRLLDEVPALEVRNGTMLAAHNALVEQLAGRWMPLRLTSPLGIVAGSDAHTLRRVGRTWTTVPGRTREEFLLGLRQGLGRPGGSHGTAGTVAGDAYGVIARYVAALAGLGPRDLRSWRRAACLAFVAVSLPAQFLPLLVAAVGKRCERREVDRASAHINATVASPPTIARELETRG